MTRSLNPVYSARPQSIFPTMSHLARKCGAINLGQGFPDEDGPKEIREIAAQAVLDGPNQYEPVEGTAALRRAVAQANKRFYDLDIDPDREVQIVSGATEGLAAAFLGFLEPGDEAVLLAPFYECYAPQIEAASAQIKIVDLVPPEWRLDADALEAAITEKTKLIAINTPHNPSGKVYTLEEINLIAELCEKHDALIFTDEIYEHILYDGREHI
uniref:aminotransferase class I/II-fold pyridoxal phosphate-dependent enzyme n=1 Tax=Hyphococcus sp. TaxID=2038636 RepID=UPI0035C6F77D